MIVVDAASSISTDARAANRSSTGTSRASRATTASYADTNTNANTVAVTVQAKTNTNTSVDPTGHVATRATDTTIATRTAIGISTGASSAFDHVLVDG